VYTAEGKQGRPIQVNFNVLFPRIRPNLCILPHSELSHRYALTTEEEVV
jgi:hypothetical protein